MANVYVYSGAAGAGTGADWTNAYTTLAAALTAKAAGDDFWVAHDHAETQASAMTLTSPGTPAVPCRIICASRSGSTPPVSADLRTTATITTTGSAGISLTRSAYVYGLIFSCGTTGTPSLTTGTSNGHELVFENCALRVASSSSATIGLGTTSSPGCYTELNNTTVQFGSTGSGISLGGRVNWRNTPNAITGATLPTNLITNAAGRTMLDGVDLSALGSGKTLVDAAGFTNGCEIFLKDCKLGSSVTITSTAAAVGETVVYLIRCDSGDTNYRHERYGFAGIQTTETTIVRTGGASDGTTPVAWKIITTANSKRYKPFEALPISIWNETTGSAITLTLQGIWGGGAVPTNADIWMDVEYLGTSGFPLGNFATSGPADQLAAGTNLSAGSGTWGGSTTKFTLSKQITPQEKGPITVYIKAALASSTFYIDPKITVT